MDLNEIANLSKDEQDNCAREFIEYLNHTLIPDLRESSRDATADDFEELISHYSVLKERN